MLSLRKRLDALLRRRDLAKPPIIFDFVQKKAYRADEAELDSTLHRRLSKRRVVKTVEGIPPQAVPQPKT
jgi:hypothetical protein